MLCMSLTPSWYLLASIRFYTSTYDEPSHLPSPVSLVLISLACSILLQLTNTKFSFSFETPRAIDVHRCYWQARTHHGFHATPAASVAVVRKATAIWQKVAYSGQVGRREKGSRRTSRTLKYSHIFQAELERTLQSRLRPFGATDSTLKAFQASGKHLRYYTLLALLYQWSQRPGGTLNRMFLLD